MDFRSPIEQGCADSIELMWFIRTFLVLVGVVLVLTGQAEAVWDITEITAQAVKTTDQLIFSVYYLYRQGGKGEVQVLSDQSRLQSGDVYKLMFIPQEDSWVYIFQSDSSGKIQQLFPMSNYTGFNPENVNPVQADTTYYIPARDKSFEVVTQTGIEQIYFLAFRERNMFLEDRYQEMLVHQIQQDPMRTEHVQEKLLYFFHTRSVSRVSPEMERYMAEEQSATGVQWVVSSIPTTEQEIIEALNVDPSTIKGEQTKGLGDAIPHDSLLDRLPKTVVFIPFREHSAKIPGESYPLLERYGRVLQNELSEIVLVIAAYANEEEERLANPDISGRRAEAVKQFLLSRFSIEERRLLVKAYGTSKPIDSNTTAEERRYNNRIEFIRIR